MGILRVEYFRKIRCTSICPPIPRCEGIYSSDIRRLPIGFPRSAMRRIVLTLAVSISSLLAAPAAMALERQDVWLSPDAYTPDMLNLFRHPELWARARERVGVFKFAPPQVDPGITAVRNSYAALKGVDALTSLRRWGIKIATEEGAIKEL